ncbi:MAG: TrkA family potassium uptake protein, partial [Candidatus Pacearchaeota archaeon]
LDKTYKIISVVGDARQEKVLLEAGIKNAEGIASCLSQDSDNILVVVTARYLSPDIKIVARANEEENIQKFKSVGADYVVSDKMIGGLRMASSLIRPTTVEFLDEMLRGKGGKVYRFEDIKIPDKFVGKTLKELFHNKGMAVVALKRNGEYIYAPPDYTKLETGDIVVLLAQPKDIRELVSS